MGERQIFSAMDAPFEMIGLLRSKFHEILKQKLKSETTDLAA
jgi:hypothetical protein